MSKLIINLPEASDRELHAAIALCTSMLGNEQSAVALPTAPGKTLVADIAPPPAEEVFADVTTAEDDAVVEGLDDIPPPPPAAEIADDRDLDVVQMPYDTRIHTSGANKTNADGKWKKRKKPQSLTDVEWKQHIKEVEDELMGLAPPPADTNADGSEQQSGDAEPVVDTIPPPPADDIPPPPPAAEAVDTTHVMTEKAGMATYQQMIDNGWNDETLVSNGMMEPLAPTASPAGAIALTWPEVNSRITKAQRDQELDVTAMNAWLEANGVKAYALMANRPELFNDFLTAMGV